MSITVCCLLYGDYPDLALRCLGPIGKLRGSVSDIRVGCNEVSERTLKVLSDTLSTDSNMTVIKESPQIYKYPMMAKLFNVKPILSDYIMWFDDDSYIFHENPEKWIKNVEDFMSNSKADMAGSLYVVPSSKNQIAWRRLHCPWYTDNNTGHQSRFATGGWWIIKSEIIKKYGWPHPMLLHRGGDALLGELMRSQNLKLASYRSGVAINANSSGKESASERRGYDEKPIGS
jgi:hypothetical protein